MLKRNRLRIALLLLSVIMLLAILIQVYDDYRTQPHLLESRYNHGAVLLKNGKVLVIAGHHLATPFFNLAFIDTLLQKYFLSTETDTILKTCELYDPETGNWHATGSLPVEMSHPDAILLQDGRVMAANQEADGTTQTFAIYNPSSETWTEAGTFFSLGNFLLPMPDGRVLAVPTIIPPPPEVPLRTYPPNSGTWVSSPWWGFYLSTKPQIMPDGRFFMDAAQRLGDTGKNWIYDPNTRRATELQIQGHTDEDGVLLEDGYCPILRPLIFDSKSGTFTKGPMRGMGLVNNDRGNQTVLADGRVMSVCDGDTECEIYDFKTNAWNTTCSLHQPRLGATFTRLQNGKVLVIGGCNHSESLSSIELYEPITGVWIMH